MKATQRILITCMAIGLGISSAYAEEAHHPGADLPSTTAETTQDVQTPDPTNTAGPEGAGMGMMGGPGGMGMMRQGMGNDHHMMMGKHHEVVSRLNLIEARLAKIEVLLERINQQ